jgi:hypothetical protein
MAEVSPAPARSATAGVVLSSPAPSRSATAGVLQAKPFALDSSSDVCQAKCGAHFSLIVRRHHCRGCGGLFCGSCVSEEPLEQYGLLPAKACGSCGAPYVHAFDEAHPLQTQGGDLLLQVYNVGPEAKGLGVMWDGAPVVAELVRTNAGKRLRVVLPPGVGGGHTLSLRRQSNGTASVLKVSYLAPTILRVSPLRTEGGEATLFCENVGDDAASCRVYVDGELAEGLTIAVPHKKLTCRVGAGVGVATVRIEAGSLAAETDVLRAAPEVMVAEPRDIPTSGGPIVLRGCNFGTDACRIEVTLPESGATATDVVILDAHSRIECILPPKPSGCRAGESIRLRVVVAGVHSIVPTAFVYSHSARAVRAHPRSTDTVAAGKDAPSPYANLFSSPLAAGKALASPGGAKVAPAGSEADLPGKHAAPCTVRVGGTISGGGPTLTVTALSSWQEDAPSCSICAKQFGLSRRRHHCRICGCCSCAACSNYQLQLAPSKPPVRVCTRCHLRVGVLSEMVAILDSVAALRRTLPADMAASFREEVRRALHVSPARLGASLPHSPHSPSFSVPRS